jgi:hypothetical protein
MPGPDTAEVLLSPRLNLTITRVPDYFPYTIPLGSHVATIRLGPHLQAYRLSSRGLKPLLHSHSALLPFTPVVGLNPQQFGIHHGEFGHDRLPFFSPLPQLTADSHEFFPCCL